MYNPPSMQAFAQSLCVAIIVIRLSAYGFAQTQPAEARDELSVSVDPRVELLSIIFNLAGHPEYSQPKVPSYGHDVREHFAPFKDHTVVKLAQTLRRQRGVSYEAPMSLAAHLRDLDSLELLMPLDPWPAGLDRRWPADELNEFLVLARQFIIDAKFRQFFDAHQPLYDLASKRMQQTLHDHARLEWFDKFFGDRPAAQFHMVLGMLNGGQCYGAGVTYDGDDELYCILGVWNVDAQGQPTFPADVVPFVVHEFCHSYANPLVDRHFNELRIAGEKLLAASEKQMRQQAYPSAHVVLRESLVRACVVRYRYANDGKDAADRETAEQVARGFTWMPALVQALAEYEGERDKYPTLGAFMPRMIESFNRAAAKVAPPPRGK